MKYMRPALWALVLGASSPALAAIQVVYGENPQDELDVENVSEIRNAYEDRIAEQESDRRAREAELRAQQEEELDQERAERKRILAEKEAELERLREKQRIAEAREEEKARISEDYKLSVDLTKKIVNHIGAMPQSLPPVASEGVEAPLIAAFNGMVPIDWQVFVHQQINDQRPVSWSSSDDNWVAVLYQLGVRYDYSFDINWDEKWVLVNNSELRLGLSGGDNPIIEVMGTDVPPGTTGHILIDGKIIKVRSTDR